MTDEQKLQDFTQKVFLTVYGRRIDDITDADGVEEVEKVKLWCNLFLDELEFEVRDDDGKPIDWNFVRENDKSIGTISGATDTFSLPSGTRKLVSHPERPLYISQAGTIVSTWDVSDPNQLVNVADLGGRTDRVTYTNQKIVFSRTLNDTEIGGTVYADVVNSMPRLSSSDTTLFDLPIPTQLLVLGTAKNSSLPDIVKGGLSPSMAQKYNDLLNGLKKESLQTSVNSTIIQDDLGYIQGVW